jgi:hypothetical protein
MALKLKNGTFQILVHLRTQALPHIARKKTMDKTYSILSFEEQPGRDLCPGREGFAIS